MSEFIQKLKVLLGVAEDLPEEELTYTPMSSEEVVPFKRERTKSQRSEAKSSKGPTLVGLSGGEFYPKQNVYYGTKSV